MEDRLLGFFSGFPRFRFPDQVAERLGQALTRRDSLVFVSAWPQDHERNDRDAAGMHGMFEACGIPFDHHEVIDTRMDASGARGLIQGACCVFLMGGYPRLQLELIGEKGLDDAIRRTPAAVLGVSAGAINMAKRSLDTKESLVPYEGLGLADITVKPHFSLEDRAVASTLLRLSGDLPICAMEDESAIFVAGGRVSHMGTIHWVSGGQMLPFSDELLQRRAAGFPS